MTVVLREYVTKGLFLGLWAYLALIQPFASAVGRVVAWVMVGLLLGIVLGMIQQWLRGYRPGRNPLGFLLLVLLDSPFVIYLGLVGGLGLGLVLETDPPPERAWLGWCAVGGALLGFGFYQLRQIPDWRWRFGLGFVVGVLLMVLGFQYLVELPSFATREAQQQLGITILLGLPFFYLLTFCGEAEESEVEIAAISAFLGLGLYLLALEETIPLLGNKAVLLLPISLYFVYSTRILPGLRVFKHCLRGYGYLSLGRIPDALLSFSAALKLNPRNELASQGLWALLKKVDVTHLDEATAGLLPLDFCLEKASEILIGDRPPRPTEREEALRMLAVVERHRPEAFARVAYLRAVAFTHAKQFDEAAAILSELLDPQESKFGKARTAVLFDAWNLALRLHPELEKRLGEGELRKPGRRMEAIRAVERQQQRSPDDPAASELKRWLYAGLTEAEYLATAGTGSEPLAFFDYDTVEQLGWALVDDPEPQQLDRGMAYLRIAARGLPEHGPAIFQKLADIAEARQDQAAAQGYLEQVKRTGLQVGPKQLTPEQRAIYVACLKRLSARAAAAGDYASAVADFRLAIEAGTEDVESLRRLAELHALNGDPLNAMLITERALLYAKNDPDLLAKKDSYYYSVDIDRIASVRDKVRSWFDSAYCLAKARQVLEAKEVDLDTLDWGLHLVRLVRAVIPESQAAMLAEARLLLRKGERDAAVQRLEDLREQPRGSGEDEDAWYLAHRLLGELYLEEYQRPDLAIACFQTFRDYQKSGADTLFHLARAYEAAKQIPSAIRYYEMVTAYQGHPRYWDASEAARRLKSETGV
jgi:tetratricopeptide (TPR) repeat protein